MLRERFFDFEVFPHWWCCTFGDWPEDGIVTPELKENFVVVTSDDVNARDKLLQQMLQKGYVQVGYNIKGYDLIIANAVYQGFTPEQIKIISDIVINPSLKYSSKEHMRLMGFANRKLKGVVYQDLMDDGSGSLKQKECVLGMDILESSVPFDKEDLSEQDKADVIYYNKQDVYASMVYFDKVVKVYTATKMAVGRRFNIPEETCRMSTNARLVAMVLKAKRKHFIDADEVVISLPERIREYCYENVPHNVLHRLLTSVEPFSIELFGNKVSYGNGGIHSTIRDDIYVEANDEWALFNIDAASYYPSMLIQFECLSRCCENPKDFEYIFNERMRLKHKPDKTKEDDEIQLAYKLVLNTTFGASGNKYLDLYDPLMCTRTCRLGQIFLTGLACKLHKVPSLKIIQTNTDGILAYCRRSQLDKVQKLMDEWTAVSGINMERDDVRAIWQRDVNNYLLQKTDGKFKVKGGWLQTTPIKPSSVTLGSVNCISSIKAATDWLLYGKDIIQSIVNNKNLYDYIICCMKGPSYSKVIQRTADGTEIDLYKSNRVIATKDKNYGRLYKVKKYKGNLSYTQMPSTPEHCLTVNNDLYTYNFDKLSKTIDYMYYIERALDLLDLNWVTIDRDGNIVKTDKFDYQL